MKNYKNILFFCFTILIIIFSYVTALDGSNSGLKKYNNFSLYDVNNKLHQLRDYSDSKAIVIMFIATQCPVSNAYNTRMAKIYSKFKDKNISFIGINSNKQESIKEIKEHAKSNNLDFVILKDSNNVIADHFEASFTPEIFVLNNKFEKLYHGRIDDSRKIANVKTSDLQNVLREIITDKEIRVKETKAFGETEFKI